MMNNFTGTTTMWIPAVGEIKVYLENGEPTAIKGPYVHEIHPGDAVDLMDGGGNVVFTVEPTVDHYGHDDSPTGDFLLVDPL